MPLRRRVSFQIERVATDRKTGKPVADVTRYTYRDGDTRYVVTFERQKTILQTVFAEEMPLIKRLLAKIVGFDGAYHRFTGKVTIEKFEKDRRLVRMAKKPSTALSPLAEVGVKWKVQRG